VGQIVGGLSLLVWLVLTSSYILKIFGMLRIPYGAGNRWTRESITG
jgi:hypothetical protein